MAIDTGGPAFPCKVIGTDEHGEYRTPWQGMTLRDHFAGLAMQGAFSSPIESSTDGKEYIAMHAYKMADAMLRARSAR